MHAEVQIGDTVVSLTQAYDDDRLYSPQSAPSSPVKENRPAPTGGGNVVQGNKEDQCARL